MVEFARARSLSEAEIALCVPSGEHSLGFVIQVIQQHLLSTNQLSICRG